MKIKALFMFFIITSAIFSEVIDSLPKDSAAVDTIPLENKKISWYFTLTPRVGVDKIQKDYASFLKQRSDSVYAKIRRDDGANIRQEWYQDASPSGVSFYLETGLAVNVNEKTGLDLGLGYSFNMLRSTYGIETSLDSTEILRMRTLLVNNTAWFSADYKVSFDTSFFNIKGIDRAGFYFGGALVYSMYFERDTIKTNLEKYDEYAENTKSYYDGLGGAGRTGLFARKKLGKRAEFEYSIGYLFLATSGYEGFWQNRKHYFGDNNNNNKIMSISSSFELSFSLIF